MTSVLIQGDRGLAVRRFRCAADGRRAQANIESDGIGGAFMLRVCAWCKADMGRAPCDPADAGKVTHGMCPACKRRLIAELPGVPHPAGCPGKLNFDGGNPGSASSAAAGQVATPLPSPLFWCVTGMDFGRVIRWARERWRNPLDALVRDKINQIKK